MYGQGGGSSAPGIERIADVPIYFADPLVRRSPPLQATPDARAPKAWMNSRLMQKLGVKAGQSVTVNGAARLEVGADEKLPDDCVRIPAAHPATVGAGPMFGAVSLARAG